MRNITARIADTATMFGTSHSRDYTFNKFPATGGITPLQWQGTIFSWHPGNRYCTGYLPSKQAEHSDRSPTII